MSVVQQQLDWREVGADEDWDVAWLDNSVSVTRVMRLSTGQAGAAAQACFMPWQLMSS